MRHHFYTLDVFTERRFAGNPLAVVLDAESIPGERMQMIAAEFNLSETVFVMPPVRPGNAARVRIFTPRAELPFAGHPTIGTALLLAKQQLGGFDAAEPMLVLEEAVGDVPVDIRIEQGVPRVATMSVPRLPKRGPAPPDAAELAAMLSLSVHDLLPEHPPCGWSCGVPFLFVAVRDRAAVGRAKLRTDIWEKLLLNWWAPSVFVFTFDTESAAAQVHARMFAPAFGIAEDPATGGAVSALAGYLCDPAATNGDFRWLVEQGYEMGRPSQLELEAQVAGGRISSVRVGGRAVVISEGWIDAG
jgi:trans-2,3-dihydro-3-hydroxyanthranilate isomerase